MELRILQLIDSLDAGGAERVAVNFANALTRELSLSAIASTRKEGALRTEIRKDAKYIFLGKKSAIDINATLRLRKFCVQHRITHIHAHGSSYWTALLAKITMPSVKLAWHNHNGQTERISGLPLISLKLASVFFVGILSVNERLRAWAERELHSKSNLYMPNFVSVAASELSGVKLPGLAGKRVVCVANLRYPKAHLTLLQAVVQIKNRLDGWTFHLVGKDAKDAYSGKITKFIAENGLADIVYLHGAQRDSAAFIAACDIGVLSSDAEGLPLAVLEYGALAKPVVLTQVGEIPNIVKNGANGLTVPAGNPGLFAGALLQLIQDPELRDRLGRSFRETVASGHSETAIIHKYLGWLSSL